MMKKRILSGILCLSMILAAAPPAYAADTAITETTTTLTDSAYVVSKTVTLEQSLRVPQDKLVSLNLKGTLNSPTNGAPAVIVENGGHLQIAGTGTIKSSQIAVKVEAGGYLTLQGGKITTDGPAPVGPESNPTDIQTGGRYGIVSEGGSVTIEGGSVTASEAALTSTTDGTIFYIKGGTLKSTTRPAVYLEDETRLEMSGGTVEGIVARTGSIQISGGTVTAAQTSNAESIKGLYSFPGCAPLYPAIALLTGTRNDAVTLDITGGIIQNKRDHEEANAVALYVGGATSGTTINQNATVTISNPLQKDDEKPAEYEKRKPQLSATNAKAVGMYYLPGYVPHSGDATTAWNASKFEITGGYFSDDLTESVKGENTSGTQKTVLAAGYDTVQTKFPTGGQTAYEVQKTVPVTVNIQFSDNDTDEHHYTLTILDQDKKTVAEVKDKTAQTPPAQNSETVTLTYGDTYTYTITGYSKGDATAGVPIPEKQYETIEGTLNITSDDPNDLVLNETLRQLISLPVKVYADEVDKTEITTELGKDAVITVTDVATEKEVKPNTDEKYTVAIGKKYRVRVKKAVGYQDTDTQDPNKTPEQNQANIDAIEIVEVIDKDTPLKIAMQPTKNNFPTVNIIELDEEGKVDESVKKFPVSASALKFTDKNGETATDLTYNELYDLTVTRQNYETTKYPNNEKPEKVKGGVPELDVQMKRLYAHLDVKVTPEGLNPTIEVMTKEDAEKEPEERKLIERKDGKYPLKVGEDYVVSVTAESYGTKKVDVRIGDFREEFTDEKATDKLNTAGNSLDVSMTRSVCKVMVDVVGDDAPTDSDMSQVEFAIYKQVGNEYEKIEPVDSQYELQAGIEYFYSVTSKVPDYYKQPDKNEKFPFTVEEGATTYDIVLERQTASLKFDVTLDEPPTPAPGIQIQLTETGPDAPTDPISPDTNGVYPVFVGKTYSYSISADKDSTGVALYKTENGTVPINAEDEGKEKTEKILLKRVGILTPLQITFDDSPKPLPDVKVMLKEANAEAPEEQEPEKNKDDGNITAELNLAKGKTYSYTVSSEGYETVTVDKIVATDGMSLEPIEMKRRSAVVAVKVMPEDINATVKVTAPNGSEIPVSNGKYALPIPAAGAEKVTYTATITAPGYRPATQTIEVTKENAAALTRDGITVNMIQLHSTYEATFTLTTPITGSSDATKPTKPVAGATITILDQGGNVVGSLVTDQNGQCSQRLNDEGTYKYTVDAPGYVAVPDGVIDGGKRVTDKLPFHLALTALTYQVKFNFTDEAGEALTPGAAFQLTDGDGNTVSPNANGVYTLKQPEVSRYTVTNDADAFDYNSVSATVLYDPQATQPQVINVSLVKTKHEYPVSLKLENVAEGVTPVVKYGEGAAANEVTPANGVYTFTVKNNRTTVYTVTADGYSPVSGYILPTASLNPVTIVIPMIEVAKQYTAQFTAVSDDSTVLDPLPDTVSVIVRDSNGNEILPLYDGSGNRTKNYHLDNTQTYSYTVTADRFSPATGTIAAGTAAGMVKEIRVAMKPVPHTYQLKFNVTAADGGRLGNLSISYRDAAASDDVKPTQVKMGEAITLDNTHSYTYTVSATGKNTVTGTILPKTDTEAETIDLQLTSILITSDTKLRVIAGSGSLSNLSQAEADALIRTLSASIMPAGTYNVIEAAAEKMRTALLQDDSIAGAIRTAAATLGIAKDEIDKNTYLMVFLQAEIQSYQVAKDGTRRLALHVTPMVQVVVSNKQADAAFDFGTGEGDTNAIKVGAARSMNSVSGPVQLALRLPDNFVANTTDPVYVTHNAVSTFRTLLDDKHQISFTASGFGPFQLSTKDSSGSVVYNVSTNKGYATFQDALDDVRDGQTLVIAPTAPQPLTGTVNRTISFRIITPQGITVEVRDGNNNVVIPVGNLYTITEKEPDKPDPPTPVQDGYSITVTHGSHGEAWASKKSAKEGVTITVYINADSGFELDDIDVRDKDDRNIRTTRLDFDEYTFVMPDSRVTVDVSFRSEDYFETDRYRDDDEKEAVFDHGIMPFPDVRRSDWFYSAVKYVYDRKIMDGKGVGFMPNSPVTRGMVVTILYRLEGQPESGESNFSDVQAGQYYSQPVNWASRHGIVTGYGDGEFGPNDSITREQFAAILYRYAQYKGYSTSSSRTLGQYNDAINISNYALTAMRWANAAGLITGTSDNTLQPNGTATRAQAAMVMQRLCEDVAKH